MEDLSKEYDNLKTDNDTLNYQLELEKAKIQEMLKELKQTKNSSYSQLKKYKNEVSSLKTLIQNYAFQVDSLNMLSLQLQEENIFYKEEAEKTTARVDSLTSENEELQQIVQKASALEPVGLEAYPANKRNKPVRRLGWTRKLKVDFTLPRNVAVPAGQKEVYVIITRPDGVIVSNSLGETFNYNDEATPYTMMRTINYENDVLPVSLFWENDKKSLIKGQYNVQVVVDGKLTGATNFRIK